MPVGIWPFDSDEDKAEKTRQRIENLQKKFAASDARLQETRDNLFVIMRGIRKMKDTAQRTNLEKSFQEMNKNYNYLIAKDREIKLKILKDPGNLKSIKTFTQVTALAGLGVVPLIPLAIWGAISITLMASISIYFLTHTSKQKALLEQSRTARLLVEKSLEGELTPQQEKILERQQVVLKEQTRDIMKKGRSIFDILKFGGLPIVPLALGGAAVYYFTKRKKPILGGKRKRARARIA